MAILILTAVSLAVVTSARIIARLFGVKTQGSGRFENYVPQEQNRLAYDIRKERDNDVRKGR